MSLDYQGRFEVTHHYFKQGITSQHNYFKKIFKIRNPNLIFSLFSKYKGNLCQPIPIRIITSRSW